MAPERPEAAAVEELTPTDILERMGVRVDASVNAECGVRVAVSHTVVLSSRSGKYFTD